ncbi:MAG: hypothetical protein UW84_C0016G0012 [Candidatus Collierbacteria bacterium GW2011_GWA2_44_99]|uniref:Uncharacterized protein n=1 Tax=Candidatus Collierbacteria bacterium GW2011_GWA2_44_99 TaxID=1618380 RepID=A0A0G1KRF6_9BACT|nr:MAG: hypothetical protein UW84_C0016G0012 [Candidatus Collierbacteria bacterium GW2011_GWA2_44_99]
MDTVSISTLPNPATGIPLTTNISGLLVAAASVRITNGFIGIIMTLTAFVVVRIITTMLGLGTIV